MTSIHATQMTLLHILFYAPTFPIHLRFFAHIYENENFLETIKNDGLWGYKTVLALFVMKFDIDLCVFNQGHDVKNRKIKIITIHTSD